MNYPYYLIILGVANLPFYILLMIYVFTPLKGMVWFFVSLSVFSILFFSNLLTAIYVKNETLIFKALSGRKKILQIEDLYEVGEYHKGVYGTGYFFNNNVKVRFLGRPNLSFKKINEYKRFVYWLSDYKKSLYPDSDGIKIGRLVV